MYAQTRQHLRPIDLCVLEAERKRAKARRPRREPSKSVQFAGMAMLIGSLFFLAFMLPMAVIVQMTMHSMMWLFGVPVIGLASLIFGGILAGNIGFDVNETPAEVSPRRETIGNQRSVTGRSAVSTRRSLDTVHTAA